MKMNLIVSLLFALFATSLWAKDGDTNGNTINAVLQPVSGLLSNDDNEGTEEELHFIYVFLYNWEERLHKQEGEDPVESGSEFVERSIIILNDIQKEIYPPSKRSMETAVFSVEQIIKVLKRASQCSKDLDGFADLFNLHYNSLTKAIEMGLLKDKSLNAIKDGVDAAAKKALESMENCP